MKNIFSATGIVLFIICGCSLARIPVNTPEINTRVKDDRVVEMLLGHCSRSCLLESPYKEWFVKNYNDYVVDSFTAARLQPLLKEKTIAVFLGTWCGDSRREVPRLIKLMDYCSLPDEALKLVMVDYREGAYKQSPQHEEKGKWIFRIPTIILYSGNNELGRIIEFPRQSLEKDLLTILNKESYIPNYDAGNSFLYHIEKSSLLKLYADSAGMSKSLQARLRNSFE